MRDYPSRPQVMLALCPKFGTSRPSRAGHDVGLRPELTFGQPGDIFGANLSDIRRRAEENLITRAVAAQV